MRKLFEFAGRIDANDVIGVIGLALIVAGVACWSLPAALILAGFMLFAYASALHLAAWGLIGGLLLRHGTPVRKPKDGDIRRAS